MQSAGEILISVDRAIEQAHRQGAPLSHELSLYLVHGWLHLAGMKTIHLNPFSKCAQLKIPACNCCDRQDNWMLFALSIPQLNKESFMKIGSSARCI